MLRFILRRLVQAALTILGVMVLTFLLFRVMAGDIAAAHKGEKATEPEKAEWRYQHGYDRPLLINLHRRPVLIDHSLDFVADSQPATARAGDFVIEDAPDSKAADALAFVTVQGDARRKMGRYVFGLDRGTPIADVCGGKVLDPVLKPYGVETPTRPRIRVLTAGGQDVDVDLAGVKTYGEFMDRINGDPANRDERTGGLLVEATFSPLAPGGVLNSQFLDHLYKSATFRTESLAIEGKRLTEIIAERAPKSLALMIPATALGWAAAMIISCFVAYYRDTLIDRIGVLLSVLGMCVPFLAFMILGQWLMFKLSPRHAYGLAYRANLYVPVAIMVIAGLGESVRFYRTVILDEVNRDYVRTARAKGAPLTSVLFKHVLRNCMLPILTNIVLMLPFLIMGSLLVETYFGIPGLGDLMLSSIERRDEPVLNGLVFLSALFYTVGVLLTDISYAVFDPRVRLQ